MRNEISHCPITMSSTSILKPWIPDKYSKAYSQHNILHTGVDIQATAVHSICYGVVIHIGKASNNLYAVTVQYDAYRCVRYCHLQSVCVAEGSAVESGTYIGKASKFVHFEYISTARVSPTWIVRINLQTYYKQDPTPLVTNQVVLESVYTVQQVTEIKSSVVLTDAMQSEFSGNRGDDSV